MTVDLEGLLSQTLGQYRSVHAIYRWIDRKGLPAHRVGRLWKFKTSEVDDWVRAGGSDEGKTGEEASNA
ncbi:MAG: helix-turn-helix domain-containing protein [Gammaproteobacteria bacterium]|nr:helix-turn-helix domain-containing protein [Gammaproteobacteria bacterium]